jgi:hypothetical protein
MTARDHSLFNQDDYRTRSETFLQRIAQQSTASSMAKP